MFGCGGMGGNLDVDRAEAAVLKAVVETASRAEQPNSRQRKSPCRRSFWAEVATFTAACTQRRGEVLDSPCGSRDAGFGGVECITHVRVSFDDLPRENRPIHALKACCSMISSIATGSGTRGSKNQQGTSKKRVFVEQGARTHSKKRNASWFGGLATSDHTKTTNHSIKKTNDPSIWAISEKKRMPVQYADDIDVAALSARDRATPVYHRTVRSVLQEVR